MDDRHGRGQIFPHLSDYILKRPARAFVRENVQGLLGKSHRGVWKQMLATLRSNGKYLVRARVLNTLNFGIPQNRPHVYIVGVLRTRAPGISQLVSLADKVRTWATATDVHAPPLLECLERVTTTDPEDIVAAVLAPHADEVSGADA